MVEFHELLRGLKHEKDVLLSRSLHDWAIRFSDSLHLLNRYIHRRTHKYKQTTVSSDKHLGDKNVACMYGPGAHRQEV